MLIPMNIKIGGRGSKLSLIQMHEVSHLITSKYPEASIEFIKIKTYGDIDKSSPLYKTGSKGLFEKEVNKELLKGKIDMAVHSAKDVLFDSLNYEDFYISIPIRRSRSDAFVSRSGSSLLDIPSGSIIGSSSIRRISYVKYLRKDLKIMNIRGNIDTRLRKVFNGEYDGIILAEAALNRLESNIRYERLPNNDFVPAAGQGALIVLVRKDSEYEDLAREINSKRFFTEVMIEKMITWLLGGGCDIPLGVTCLYDSETGLINVFAAIVDTQYNAKKVFRKKYSFPDSYATDMNRLRRVAVDFYKFFLESGGEMFIKKWLENDS